MNFRDFNKRLFVILYRKAVNPDKISFPENAANVSIAFIWMLNILSAIWLIMRLLNLKLTPMFVFVLLGLVVILFLLSNNTFLARDKYKAIINDDKYKETKYDSLILLATFLISFVLPIIISYLFRRQLFLG